MNLLIANAGVGKTTLFRRLSTASDTDILQLMCLFGNSVAKDALSALNSDEVYDDLIEKALKQCYHDPIACAEWPRLGISLFYMNKFFSAKVKSVYYDSLNDEVIDKQDLSTTKSSTELEKSWRITLPCVPCSGSKVVTISAIYRLFQDDTKSGYLGLKVVTMDGEEFFGFDQSIFYTDIRPFDGFPYIHVGEGNPSLRELYPSLSANDYFYILGNISTCFIDSITADFYGVSHGSALKSGLSSEAVSLFAHYNKSRAVLIYTPVFYDESKEPLTGFNRRGYSSGEIFVGLNQDIKKINDLSSIGIDDLAETVRNSDDRSLLRKFGHLDEFDTSRYRKIVNLEDLLGSLSSYDVKNADSNVNTRTTFTW